MTIELGKKKWNTQTKTGFVNSVTDLKRLFTEKMILTSKSDISIDYPKIGEKLNPNHYAIRISASGGDNIQISIDKNDWMPCRQEGGYYWFDWHSISEGRHEIVARMKLQTGRFEESRVISIVV